MQHQELPENQEDHSKAQGPLQEEYKGKHAVEKSSLLIHYLGGLRRYQDLEKWSEESTVDEFAQVNEEACSESGGNLITYVHLSSRAHALISIAKGLHSIHGH